MSHITVHGLSAELLTRFKYFRGVKSSCANDEFTLQGALVLLVVLLVVGRFVYAI